MDRRAATYDLVGLRRSEKPFDGVSHAGNGWLTDSRGNRFPFCSQNGDQGGGGGDCSRSPFSAKARLEVVRDGAMYLRPADGPAANDERPAPPPVIISPDAVRDLRSRYRDRTHPSKGAPLTTLTLYHIPRSRYLEILVIDNVK